jgi:excisionase family DNA binding protein
MLTVPEAAKRAGRNPETIRRWIREGKLAARKVGTQHVLEEQDLAEALAEAEPAASMPAHWRVAFWGGPMPDWDAIIREQRDEH